MAKKKYTAAPGAGFNDEDAQRYGEAIEEISRKHGGITPELFVAEAPNFSIKEQVEPDNDVAAHQWRLQQARTCINRIMVEVVAQSGEKYMARAFHSVSVEVEGVPVRPNGEPVMERRYIQTAVIVADEPKRGQLGQQITNMLTNVADRYGEYEPDYPEFTRAFTEIGKLKNIDWTAKD